MATSGGRARRFERAGSTFIFGRTGWRVTVSICTPSIVRVDLDIGARGNAGRGRRASSPSHIVERDWPAVDLVVTDSEPLRVSTGALSLDIETDPVRLALVDANGAWLLREPADGGMSAELVGDGGRRRVRARFAFSGEQHFYGLGQGGRELDRLGVTRQLWNTQLGHGPGSDIAVPLLLSSRGYGLFFDNASDAALSVGRSDNGVRIVYTAEAGRLTWYFLMGPDMRGVLGQVADLLGRAPMPPRWALGFLQSTRHFDDTEELRQLPRTIRAKRIPCDALIYLSSYGEALGWNRGVGHLEFQPELWPDPATMVAEARAQHFEMITHEYPVVHEKSPLFAEAAARGHLLPEGYERAPVRGRPPAAYRDGQRYVDFSDPAARAWWWGAHRELASLGVAGWWLDGGEGPPAASRLHGGEGTLLHNMYDRFRQQAFAEGEAADRPDQRVFLLCRSGAAGMQQFGAACWSGDINNDFTTLEAQIPLGLNTGLSGVPYWGTDVGGFFHAVPETGELYARWFQFGAFCPVFRSHGWVWREHVPWAHGPEIETICRSYAELRYRLLPYTYTLAWQARTLGLPLMRALVLNYPDDPRVWGLGSQYLWGDDLLVVPVTREGARSWPVYLPAGAWYDFWTGTRHDGPRGVAVDAPLDRLPLFVRAGAIVPMGPVIQHTGEPQEEITLLIYPGEGTSRFDLYEDDGRTNNYRSGHYALTSIECTTSTLPERSGPDRAGAVPERDVRGAPEGQRVTITIGAPQGDPSVIPAGRHYVIRLRTDQPATTVIAEGPGPLPHLSSPSETRPGWWQDTSGFIKIRPGARPTTKIEIRTT